MFPPARRRDDPRGTRETIAVATTHGHPEYRAATTVAAGIAKRSTNEKFLRDTNGDLGCRQSYHRDAHGGLREGDA